MNDKIGGFVLSVSEYREGDDLLKVLTKEYGILSFVARGARKAASRNRYLPMCLYEFLLDYKDGKTMYTIHSGKLIESFYEDRDLEKMSYLNIFLETAGKMGEWLSASHYDDLLFVFRHYSREDRYLLGCLYFAKLCQDFGISPFVDGCAVCGKKQVVSLSNRQGGFLCLEHHGGEEILDVITLKKFRLINKASFEHFDLLKEYGYDRNDFRLLADFFFDNSSLHCRSYDFYMSL
ncbi:MAG: DNA repair protein RecO [Erysipelotrichaceae bacterium]|nr:DNA repair protein RecO [Erysipelotrichaceae bacterium]